MKTRIIKHFLLSCIICLQLLPLSAQDSKKSVKLGVAVNSDFNTELRTYSLSPTLIYLKNKSQYELGMGLNPLDLSQQRILSTELNHKFFPNGMENKYRLYFVSQLKYAKQLRKNYFNSTYNYLFLNAGYGLNVNPSEKFYLSTDVKAGIFSFSNESENPFPAVKEQSLFEEIGFNLTFGFNLGYLF
ncbi:hypothetical protein GYB29_07485 [bacterium]|nr:hypothetical protein [bacterium]